MQCDIAKGFVPNMNVPGTCYVNSDLEKLIFDELEAYSNTGGHGGFLPAVKQLANVAALPGIVGVSCTPDPKLHTRCICRWYQRRHASLPAENETEVL